MTGHRQFLRSVAVRSRRMMIGGARTNCMSRTTGSQSPTVEDATFYMILASLTVGDS
jgi:hypothetical protein